MSPYGYIQLFLFGLLYSGAISEENVTCPRSQRNIHINQLHGDWFVAQSNARLLHQVNKTECYIMSVTKINETTLNLSTIENGEKKSRASFSIENAENAGTWRSFGSNARVEVILSSDGTTMAMLLCDEDLVEPDCILMAKQLPISSENAGITESLCRYNFKSEATCQLP